MQLITLDRKQARVIFWAIAGFVGVAFALTGDQEDPGLVAAAMVLAALSVWPFYFWLTGHSQGLPIWPVFVAVSGLNGAMPVVQDSTTLASYTPAEIFTGCLTIGGFIVLGTAIWIGLTNRPGRPPRMVRMVEARSAETFLFLFAASQLILAVVQEFITLPGGLIPVFRSLAGSLMSMGLFTLSFYLGRGMLTRGRVILLGVIGTLSILVGSIGLLLINSLVPLAMMVMGYMLGSNKFPWRVFLVAFFGVAILHAGKYEMRSKYWGEQSPGIHLYTLPQFYWEWMSFGLEEGGGLLGVVRPKSDDADPSIFERSGTLHMLLVVQQKSPREVPFLEGLTYQPIPRLLLPRFLDEDKGISHAGNIMLTVNYGLQTIEQTGNTSIFWGIIPEAYANYGYPGVFGLAVLLALFYGYMTRLTVGVPMTTLRFVIGLLVMAAATKADTMGVFITTQFQGIMGVAVASMFLMKRRENPFAAGGGGENAESGKAERLKGKWGARRQGAWSVEQGAGTGGRQAGDGPKANRSRMPDDGLPASGVLAGLIEGAPVGRAQHGAGSMEHGAGSGEREAGNAVATPRDVGTGGAVRTMPIKTPKRVARWMPRRVRAAVVAEAARSAAEGGNLKPETGVGEGEGLRDEETKRPKDGRERPRQVAVPYRNYRRYRG
jgi:hypothetical protein